MCNRDPGLTSGIRAIDCTRSLTLDRVMALVVGGSGSGSGDGARGGGEARQVYPSLTNTNYTSWCIRVQAIMEDRDEWEVVEPDLAAAPTAEEVAKLRTKDKKIKAHLLQCIPDDILM